MNYKELTKIAQAQNKALMITIESLQSSLNSQSKTIASLTSEITELKNLLLSQGKSKEKAVNQLNGLLQIHLPKKTEKRNYVDTSLKSSTPAPTPQERGN